MLYKLHRLEVKLEKGTQDNMVGIEMLILYVYEMGGEWQEQVEQI